MCARVHMEVDTGCFPPRLGPSVWREGVVLNLGLTGSPTSQPASASCALTSGPHDGVSAVPQPSPASL